MHKILEEYGLSILYVVIGSGIIGALLVVFELYG